MTNPVTQRVRIPVCLILFCLTVGPGASTGCSSPAPETTAATPRVQGTMPPQAAAAVQQFQRGAEIQQKSNEAMNRARMEAEKQKK
ncbi:MAG: hypothetical protein SFU56_13905 [Capsulimonadales bacterium]|nr:hypothetical protein [Capsulimonadales bacterium]